MTNVPDEDGEDGGDGAEGDDDGGTVAESRFPTWGQIQTKNISADDILRGSKPEPVSELDRLEQKDRGQDITLKAIVAAVALLAMVAQIIMADYVFMRYGDGHKWLIPTAAIDVWLTATVVEVIGIVLVITKYLFPKR